MGNWANCDDGDSGEPVLEAVRIEGVWVALAAGGGVLWRVRGTAAETFCPLKRFDENAFSLFNSLISVV